MIATLLKKDRALLRNYLRCAAVATVACYLIHGCLALVETHYQDQSMQTFTVRCFLTLRGGSALGLIGATFFSALLAGSVLTLERADRSAEFLACLPPSRMQNLLSKLAVVFGISVLMSGVHVLASIVADSMLPYIPATHSPSADGMSGMTIMTFASVIMSMIGGALAVSAWLKSNGVPILIGLLTPFIMLVTLSLIYEFLQLPIQGEQFSMRFAIVTALTGVFLTFCGSYWYLERVEP